MLGEALLIRRVEEQVSEMVGVDFPGSTHFCIGQELTAVAACAAIRPDDRLFTTHRNRAHVLARGGDPRRVLAELLGKEAGYNRGKGGSFHLAAPELNVPVASAMVGGSLPVAAGAALGARLEGRQQVVLAFFGDRAINEGAFHETVNLAALWTLPLIFLCENNDAVPYDPTRSSLAMRDVPAYVAGYEVPAVWVDGGDVEAVWARVSEAVSRARAGRGPTFVEARTRKGPVNETRAPGLPGGKLNLADVWEPTVDHPLPEWRAADPVLNLAKALVGRGLLDRAGLLALDEEVEQQAREAAAYARAAAYPRPGSALEDVYA